MDNAIVKKYDTMLLAAELLGPRQPWNPHSKCVSRSLESASPARASPAVTLTHTFSLALLQVAPVPQMREASCQKPL